MGRSKKSSDTKPDDFVFREVPDKTISPVTKKTIELPVSLPGRRVVRYTIATIMNGVAGDDDDTVAIHDIIAPQLADGMEWKNFMRVWDIDRDDPFLVVPIGG